MKKDALIQFLNIENDQNEIDNITEIDDSSFSWHNEEYEVLTDEEADVRCNEELDSYLDECVLAFAPEEVFVRYFDRDSWKRDARYDGRGIAIAKYDGNENEETVNGETFYIYRQN